MMFSKTIVTGIAIIALITGAMIPLSSKAASQDECAIWLCLPGGFPSGCSGAYSAYMKRIKKLKPPLPPFASCAVDSSSQGRYEMGINRWHDCPEGTVTLNGYDLYQNADARRCISQQCLEQHPDIVTRLREGFPAPDNCPMTHATLREKPNFIKMWVDNDYLGQFFY